MEPPAFWRDLRDEFRSLRERLAGQRLAVMPGLQGKWVLHEGASDRESREILHGQFRALATRGGAAIGAPGDQAFERWVGLLEQRSPRFTIIVGESVNNVFTDPCDLPIGQLDADTTEHLSEIDRTLPSIVVDPPVAGRYRVIAGHEKLAATLASGAKTVSCRIRESTERVETKSGWIKDVCLASAELCTELETEAFLARPGRNDVHRQGESPESASDCSAGRRADVDSYIEEVWTKSGRKITRTSIWRSARYESRTEFERWQRCDPKTTKGADERFRRILREKPHLT